MQHITLKGPLLDRALQETAELSGCPEVVREAIAAALYVPPSPEVLVEDTEPVTALEAAESVQEEVSDG